LKSEFRVLLVLAVLLSLAALFVVTVPEASASTQAKFEWSCGAYANCAFFEIGTGSTPTFFFGDSTSGSGPYHYYPQIGGYTNYFVEMVVWIGSTPYETSCTISVYHSGVGGDITSTGGTCG